MVQERTIACRWFFINAIREITSIIDKIVLYMPCQRGFSFVEISVMSD